MVGLTSGDFLSGIDAEWRIFQAPTICRQQECRAIVANPCQIASPAEFPASIRKYARLADPFPPGPRVSPWFCASGAGRALTEDRPQNWQEDLRLMLKNSREEPARPDTFEKIRQLKRRAASGR
jgi:hypothetical protein